jgi:hypothetical protein
LALYRIPDSLGKQDNSRLLLNRRKCGKLFQVQFPTTSYRRIHGHSSGTFRQNTHHDFILLAADFFAPPTAQLSARLQMSFRVWRCKHKLAPSVHLLLGHFRCWRYVVDCIKVVVHALNYTAQLPLIAKASKII